MSKFIRENYQSKMKEISLTQGLVALVDDEDFEYLNQFYWQANGRNKKQRYASRSVYNGMGKSMGKIMMHREIMSPNSEELIDHKDSNGLNNQKSNLRKCTHSQNMSNRKAVGKSRYLGVSVTNNIKSKPYLVKVRTNGKRIHVGYFADEIEAALAYNKYAEQHHKEFAKLNVITT